MSTAPDAERKVRALVDRYAAAVTAADDAAIGEIFHPDARMTGYLGPDLVSAPIGEFAKVVADSAANPDRAAGYAYDVVSVTVTDRIAVITFEEKGYLGAAFHNVFTCIERDGTWTVASKTFTTL